MKPITEQRCAFCQYKCGREGSYKLEICGEEWFYCSEECIRRDLGIDDKKWTELRSTIQHRFILKAGDLEE